VDRILVVASADGVPFEHVRGLRISLYDAAADEGDPYAYFDVKPETGAETALICGELYRRGDTWKFRALGEGYSNGLVGLATDFGISVDESEAAQEPAQEQAPQQTAPLPVAPPQPAPAQPAPAPAYGYPQPPMQPPAAPPAYGYPQPVSAPPDAPQPAYGYPQPAGSPAAGPDPHFKLPPQGPQFLGR
jgi:TerD domain-containing protein